MDTLLITTMELLKLLGIPTSLISVFILGIKFLKKYYFDHHTIEYIIDKYLMWGTKTLLFSLILIEQMIIFHRASHLDIISMILLILLVAFTVIIFIFELKIYDLRKYYFKFVSLENNNFIVNNIKNKGDSITLNVADVFGNADYDKIYIDTTEYNFFKPYKYDINTFLTSNPMSFAKDNNIKTKSVDRKLFKIIGCFEKLTWGSLILLFAITSVAIEMINTNDFNDIVFIVVSIISLFLLIFPSILKVIFYGIKYNDLCKIKYKIISFVLEGRRNDN